MVSLQMIVEGSVRPAESVGGLVIDAKVVNFDKISHEVEVEIQCNNEDEDFLLALSNDIGFKLKTHATVTQVLHPWSGMRPLFCYKNNVMRRIDLLLFFTFSPHFRFVA